MAEYLSVGATSPLTAMWMRDALVRGDSLSPDGEVLNGIGPLGLLTRSSRVPPVDLIGFAMAQLYWSVPFERDDEDSVVSFTLTPAF